MPAKDFLFGPAREKLISLGMTDKSARSLLGKACSVQGDERAAQAIRDFISDDSLDLQARVASLTHRRGTINRDRGLGAVNYDAGLPVKAAA